MAASRAGHTVRPMNPTTPMLPRLDLVRVETVMNPTMIACDASATLPMIARIFAEERIHSVIVAGTERARDGERLTWGIISDSDLMRALDATGESVTAGVLAGTPPVTVDVQEPLTRVVQLMCEHEVTHLLVVENDYPVGIVSALDVARAAGGV